MNGADARRHSCWVEVDLGAVEGNVASVRRRTGTAVMAVVKAGAYGHGAVPVARAALRGGATWLAVARVEEGLALRADGLDAPVLVLGATPPDRLEDAVLAGLSLTVWEPGQVEAAGAAARRHGTRARLHLEVDTGMTRLGVPADDVLLPGLALAATAGVEFEGLYTHFACADDPASATVARQESLLREAAGRLRAAGLRPRLVHAANSAAALRRPDAAHDVTHDHPGDHGHDLVRLGIALYGLRPGPDVDPGPDVRAALSWRAVLTRVRAVPPGTGIGYGHAYRTAGVERIGTLAVGYGDGWRRAAGNEVLVRGRRVPVVGRVCMDQCMVRLDAVPDAVEGDEAVLIGAQGTERITADDVAARWDTIGYEVVCGIAARVPRLYRRTPLPGAVAPPALVRS